MYEQNGEHAQICEVSCSSLSSGCSLAVKLIVSPGAKEYGLGRLWRYTRMMITATSATIARTRGIKIDSLSPAPSRAEVLAAGDSTPGAGNRKASVTYNAVQGVDGLLLVN